MRTVEMEGTKAPAINVSRHLIRMSGADFKLLLDASAKKNNRLGMLAESSIQHRMIMDDTEIVDAIVHHVLYCSINNDLDGIKRLMQSIHQKHEMVMEKKKDHQPEGVLVHEIEEGESRVSKALGISEERESVLLSQLQEIMNEGISVSASLQKMSTYCIHPNEVAYCSYVMGRSIELKEPEDM